MKWSETENAIRTVCQRLAGGGLGVIPDALYLLNLPGDRLSRLPMLLVYHEAPLSDDERERLYRRAAYFGGAELPLVRSVLYLTCGLNISLETVEIAQASVGAVPAGAQLLWNPGLDWAVALSTLSATFQPRHSPPGCEEAGSRLIFGEG